MTDPGVKQAKNAHPYPPGFLEGLIRDAAKIIADWSVLHAMAGDPRGIYGRSADWMSRVAGLLATPILHDGTKVTPEAGCLELAARVADAHAASFKEPIGEADQGEVNAALYIASEIRGLSSVNGPQRHSAARSIDCPDCGATRAQTGAFGFACAHERCPAFAQVPPDDACPVCHADCAGANPPVMNCPVRAAPSRPSPASAHPEAAVCKLT